MGLVTATFHGGTVIVINGVISNVIISDEGLLPSLPGLSLWLLPVVAATLLGSGLTGRRRPPIGVMR